jgi:hypothetical protein
MQQRQPSGMVDVRMAQDDGVHSIDIKRQRCLVAFFFVPPALYLAALEQDPCPRRFKQVTGSGNGPRCAQKCQLHGGPSFVRDTTKVPQAAYR